MGLQEDLKAATVTDAKGVELGIDVVTANGDLVRYQPGAVRITADVERGIELAGLKPGSRLATPDEVAVATEAAKRGDPDVLSALREARKQGPMKASKKPSNPAPPAVG
jgi:hypothetical protein